MIKIKKILKIIKFIKYNIYLEPNKNVLEPSGQDKQFIEVFPKQVLHLSSHLRQTLSP